MSKNLSDIYAMSTDYELLWKLINDGYNIHHYYDGNGSTFEGVAYMDFIKDAPVLWIVCRSIGDDRKDRFIKYCQDNNVRFIPPTKPRFEWVETLKFREWTCKVNDLIKVHINYDEHVNQFCFFFRIGHLLAFQSSFYLTREEAQTAAETRLIELITPKA